MHGVAQHRVAEGARRHALQVPVAFLAHRFGRFREHEELEFGGGTDRVAHFGRSLQHAPQCAARAHRLGPSAISRRVAGSTRTLASGCAVCQPVNVTLSYSWSFESQPRTTSQTPSPLSKADRNLSRLRYLPRKMPSVSNTPTLTCSMPWSVTNALAAAISSRRALLARSAGGSCMGHPRL